MCSGSCFFSVKGPYLARFQKSVQARGFEALIKSEIKTVLDGRTAADEESKAICERQALGSIYYVIFIYSIVLKLK